jgi:hypothetical protein
MDRTKSTVCKMLTAIEAPLHDIGVPSDRGMLLGIDSIPAAVQSFSRYTCAYSPGPEGLFGLPY